MKRLTWVRWLLLVLVLAACSQQTPAPTPQEGLEVRKAMTWTVLQQSGDYIQVGQDSQTNASSGDTPTNTYLPALCLKQDGRARPSELSNASEGWAKGEVALTPKLPAIILSSLEQANAACTEVFGEGWRMAEFADGFERAEQGGNFWAAGTLPTTRMWVITSSANANPWNGSTTGEYTEDFDGGAAAADTAVIDETLSNQLASYDPETGTLVFNQANTLQAAAFETGKIIVSGATDTVPAGVPPRRVTATRQEGGRLIVETQPSSIEEAVLMANISITQELSEDDIDEIIPGEDVRLYDSGSLEPQAVKCTKNLPDSISYDFERTLAGSGDNSAVIRGCVNFKPITRFDLDIGFFKIKRFEAGVGFQNEAELELEAKGNTEFKKDWDLATIKFKVIRFKIGSVPVVITPYLKIVAGIDGKVTAKFTYKLTQNSDVFVGVLYEDGDKKDANKSEFNFDAPEPSLENVTLSAQSKAFLSVKSGLSLWTSASLASLEGDVNGTAKAYFGGNAQIPGTPSWKLYAGVQFCWGYGVRLDILMFKAKEWEGESCNSEQDLWSKEGNL